MSIYHIYPECPRCKQQQCILEGVDGECPYCELEYKFQWTFCDIDGYDDPWYNLIWAEFEPVVENDVC